MIEISHAQFHIEYGHLNDEKLKKYAKTLFKKYDSVVAETLPLSDYGIHLEIENGSIKGKGTVLAAVGTIFVAVAQFGGFVQGVREISSLGKEVADKLISIAPKDLKRPPESIYWKRGDAGTLTKLERIFEKVRTGELSTSEATAEAKELFEMDDSAPPELNQDLELAVKNIKLYPQQLGFTDGFEEQPDTLQTTEPKPKRLPKNPSPPAIPNEKLRVEVWRDGKKGKTLVRVIPL